jgi:hypothetical protein
VRIPKNPWWVPWRNAKQRIQDERYDVLRQQLLQAVSIEDVEEIVVAIPGMRSKRAISPTHVRELFEFAAKRVEAIRGTVVVRA